MVTAILISTALVIAVIMIALGKASGKRSRMGEQIYWARKWNEQREKEYSENHKWCDDICVHCEQNDWCKFSEVKHDK